MFKLWNNWIITSFGAYECSREVLEFLKENQSRVQVASIEKGDGFRVVKP
jgi:hypothetical protein